VTIPTMRPFLFGPAGSIMNVPELQRLRAQTAQRLKAPPVAAVRRFKPHTCASKRRVSLAEVQERCRIVALRRIRIVALAV
jgi:hypothetical protein